MENETKNLVLTAIILRLIFTGITLALAGFVFANMIMSGLASYLVMFLVLTAVSFHLGFKASLKNAAIFSLAYTIVSVLFIFLSGAAINVAANVFSGLGLVVIAVFVVISAFFSFILYLILSYAAFWIAEKVRKPSSKTKSKAKAKKKVRAKKRSR